MFGFPDQVRKRLSVTVTVAIEPFVIFCFLFYFTPLVILISMIVFLELL